MKKNQIIFVVILVAVVILLTFLITIFAVFRIDSVEITSELYEKALIDSKIDQTLKEKVTTKYSGHSSIFFGQKEVERALNELADSNKNYLIVKKVEKISPKKVRITIAQRQIDNYCYQSGENFYHFNSLGELLQITKSKKNELLNLDNVLVNGAVALNTNVAIGQALTGSDGENTTRFNAIKIILQKLDIYFAKEDRQYRTNQYLTNIQSADVQNPYTPNFMNVDFEVKNDFHYTDKGEAGDYQISIVSINEETAAKAEKMYIHLDKKQPTHNFLIITNNANDIKNPNATWSDKGLGQP